MKKIDLNKVEILSVKNRLLEVTYKGLEEKKGLHNVEINDGYDLINVNRNIAKIVFCRTIQMDDNSLFTIVVRAESIIKFKKDDKYSNEDYKEHFKDNSIYYYRKTTVASTISLIVGQMTAAFGRNPLLIAFKDK